MAVPTKYLVKAWLAWFAVAKPLLRCLGIHSSGEVTHRIRRILTLGGRGGDSAYPGME
jgi:hypothetical protein